MIFNISNCSKSFILDQGRKTILDNIELSVNENEILCIFGKSGAGKTTLLKICAGIIEADKGSISPSPDKLKIGFIFQEDRLLPWLTAKDNVLIAVNRNPQSQKLALEKFALVGMKDKMNKMPNDLSGGERQRVAIARALAVDPDIIFMDEPFSHLDEITASQIRQEVKQLVKIQKIPVILVTHNPLEAIYMSDRIAILSKKTKTISRIIKNKIKFNGADLYYSLLANDIAKSTVKSLLDSLDD